MLARILSVFALLFAFAGPAFAQAKIATVDFQKAIESVQEGITAQARLEGMFSEKKAALEKMANNLKTMQSELEKQAMILSDAAKAQKQKEFETAYMQYQQAAAVAEGEMQQASMGATQTIFEKMKKICQTIATEKGYSLVLEVNSGGVVYAATTADITPELITRYNAQNPVKK
jgi:outer membrane protein